MVAEKGTISVNTENILPIIKKFLYSDHEIFLRELVSNGVDACQKLTKLAGMGEFGGAANDLKVEVSFDKEAKTITIKDNGVGMTADEVKKYINQIAFSGAVDFVEKYKDKNEGLRADIIGNFGLGFYSAFMVSDRVELTTKSWQEGAEAVKWSSNGTTEFELEEADKAERGTELTLHVSEEELDFLEEGKLKGILTKYCRFLPVPIFFGEEQINNVAPLWTKTPADLTDENYLSFYKELYPFAPDPLFWIHLNVDYPFNLTGILYFPQISNSMEMQRDKIQLYSRQVFVTEEVKEIVPEFLTMLHGVIDSPDIPLNVSRSYLQADGNVKKINNHITKKVADKLFDLFKADRKNFEEKWNSISMFVKFGMLSDDKFYDRAAKFALLKNTDKQFFTFEEYKEKTAALQTDKDDKLVWVYAANVDKQNTYINTIKKQSYDVLLMDEVLDSHWINQLESKLENTTLKRVDADPVHKLIEKEDNQPDSLTENDKKTLEEVFKKATEGQQGYMIEVASLSADELPVLITQPEFMRRMKEMSQMQGTAAMFGAMGDQHTVMINGNHPAIVKLLAADEELQQKTAKHLFDLGLLSINKLQGQALTDFISRSIETV